MNSLKARKLGKNNQGFTIVELLIVIVVIGILALLVITTYSGIQSKARDDKRAVDVKSMQTQLEAYNTQNGYYPSYANFSTDSWRATNMKGLDTNAVIDPSASATSLQNSTATSKKYGYQPVNSAGTSCESDQTTCVSYTLTYYAENQVNGSNVVSKKNLN